jgi:hypothetical protein
MPDTSPISASLRHADGRSWTVTLDGLVATVVANGRPGRARTFPTRADAEHFVREGVRQMAAAGYASEDDPALAAARGARDALRTGLGKADAQVRRRVASATFRDRFRWVVKLGDEPSLVTLADTPATRDGLVRALVAESSGDEAVWVAFVAGSPLLVPVLRWLRAERAVRAAERSVMPAALRTTWDDRAAGGPAVDTLDGLFTGTAAAERWAEWGTPGRSEPPEQVWAVAAPVVVGRAREASKGVPGPMQDVFDALTAQAP